MFFKQIILHYFMILQCFYKKNVFFIIQINLNLLYIILINFLKFK